MASITESLSEDYFIPDEVLIEILLRLPLLSLQLFKSVSKHWLSLVTSSYFIRRLQKPRIDTPCGLFLRDAQFCDFVPLGQKATFFSLRGFYSIIQSCNGLLLCNNFVSCAYIYYVNNPFTNLRKDIPFPRYERSTDIILAFDPTKSPYYKLVITQKKNDLHNRNWEQDWVEDRLQDWEENWGEDSDTKRILIYSSETGKWRICGPSFHKDMFRGFEDGIYWNKAIHWINYSDELHSKFDIVDHPMITNMPTPASWITNILTSALHKKGRMEHTNLFESRGSLLFLMKNKSELYHVYEMREEASKWSLKYIVDDLNNIFPWYTCFLCIVLGEREGDSYMVIESDKKIVRYNFVSKTVSALFDCRDRRYKRRDYYYYFRGRFPYIASLAGV